MENSIWCESAGKPTVLTQTACTCVVSDTCPPQLCARPHSRPVPVAKWESKNPGGSPTIMTGHYSTVAGPQGPLTLNLLDRGVHSPTSRHRRRRRQQNVGGVTGTSIHYPVLRRHDKII